MQLANVLGTATATVKHPSLSGTKGLSGAVSPKSSSTSEDTAVPAARARTAASWPMRSLQAT